MKIRPTYSAASMKLPAVADGGEDLRRRM